MLQKEIEEAIKAYTDPYLAHDLVTTGKINIILTSEQTPQLTIQLGYPCANNHKDIKQALLTLLASRFPDQHFEIKFDTRIRAHAGKLGLQRVLNIKNIIAVGSGKGGVGKSTVAVNIAAALVKEGAQVGILDADIYGPSQPLMLGVGGEKPVIEGKKFHPILRHGIYSMSIGYLVDNKAALVWRGPMLGKAMEQLIQDTLWPQLDYLIIDLPPGTGDIQLSLCQKIPLNGAVIVTTPQDLALSDVRRACEMFLKLDVPLLGIVENMSIYQCTHCGHAEELFGAGGGKLLAKDYAMPLLAEIPLNSKIRLTTDSGQPAALRADDNFAMPFYEAAKKVSALLSLQKIDHTSKFPKIIIKHDRPEEHPNEHKVR